MSQEADPRVTTGTLPPEMVQAIQAAMVKGAQPATPSADSLPILPIAPPKMSGMALIKGIFAELASAKIGKSPTREQDLDYMSETSAAA